MSDGTGAGCAIMSCGAPGEPVVANRVAGETPADTTCSGVAGGAATRALGSAYELRRLVSAEGGGAGAGAGCANSWPGLAATLALVCEPGSNDERWFRVQMRY